MMEWAMQMASLYGAPSGWKGAVFHTCFSHVFFSSPLKTRDSVFLFFQERYFRKSPLNDFHAQFHISLWHLAIQRPCQDQEKATEPPRAARAMIMAAEAAEVLPGLAGLAEAMAGMAKATTVVEARPHRQPTVPARRATKFQRAERIL